VVFEKSVHFVPLCLIGDKQVDDIVNVGNRTNQTGTNAGARVEITGARVEITGATTSFGADFSPGGNVRIAGFAENIGVLAHEDKTGAINFVGHAEDRIN